MRRLTVEIIPDLEQGGFTARVPDMPAYGEGDTEEEAIADLREALRA
jgi:predicted RNase H-like HicB family nuclease